MSERDINHVLQPYTNARLLESTGPLIVERGEGVFIYDDNGRKYIEGMAGLWNAALGFSEQRLVDAATAQLECLPTYHNFASKTHSPIILLAERLSQVSPQGLTRVFFANSGSEATDTAIKLVWYYNNARGRRQKKKIISRDRAYHGTTIASASLTGLVGNHQDFDLPLPGILHTLCPHHYRFALDGETEEEFATRAAAELEALILRERPETVAAFIGEPVMGAGGVVIPPRTYWEKIQRVCRKYDVLVIADEVVTGFGRTGKMFGSETFNISPDMMILSKQLTGGYQPLSAILFTDEIYQSIADNSNRLGSFGHGFTTGGHPVAAAVALEALALFEERRIVEQVATLAPLFTAEISQFADHPLVGHVRSIGLLGAVELVADKANKAPFAVTGRVGAFLASRCIANGVILRALGDTIAFSPPLIIDQEQIHQIFSRFSRSLDETLSWSRSQ
jgi:4-aminobutyrate--pyruvate transaminase